MVLQFSEKGDFKIYHQHKSNKEENLTQSFALPISGIPCLEVEFSESFDSKTSDEK